MISLNEPIFPRFRPLKRGLRPSQMASFWLRPERRGVEGWDGWPTSLEVGDKNRLNPAQSWTYPIANAVDHPIVF